MAAFEQLLLVLHFIDCARDNASGEIERPHTRRCVFPIGAAVRFSSILARTQVPVCDGARHGPQSGKLAMNKIGRRRMIYLTARRATVIDGVEQQSLLGGRLSIFLQFFRLSICTSSCQLFRRRG